MRCLPALFLSLLILAIAPAIGEVRDLIFRVFPSTGARGLALALGGLGLALAAVAIRRIHRGEHRLLRYGLLAGAASLVVLQTFGFGTGHARVDVAEKIHLVEYGALAALLLRTLLPRRSDLSLLLLPILGALFVGLLDEAVQWLAPRRVGEIRDVGINAIAGLLGVLLALAWELPHRFSWSLRGTALRDVLRALAVVLATAGIFVTGIHLGHEIDDPEIGRFRSRWDAAELGAISVDRAQAWAVDPPRELPVWGIEDPFLTEAAWHANHRNASHQVGDAYMAAQANRILERYYAPFLELSSFRGSGRHRWPKKLKRQVETRASKAKRDPSSYLSPVLLSRIWAWPSRGTMLTWTALAVMALLAWARKVDRSAGRAISGN